MGIALLSNVTAGSLALRAAQATGEDVYTPAGYNTWFQELVDPASNLFAASPRAVFLVLDGRELIGASGVGTLSDAEETLTPMLGGIAAAAAAHPETAFAVSTLDIPQRRLQPLLTGRYETQAAAFWRSGLEARSIPLLELAEIASEMGRASFYNRRVWYAGSIPFSQAGEKALAAEIGHLWRAIRGRRKKCLALDLDNTLWGGAIGEVGVGGIELDSVGSGARYRDMQQRVLDLKNQGILLAILSKNDREDALAGINGHPAMLLRERDFAAIRANWDPKPANLESIAEELNIGVDSFVFIDDNPVERETMRIALPQTTVPEFPSDTSQLERFMIEVAREHFLLLHTTEEDLAKTEQYRAEARRQERRSAFASVEDYLRSLEMTLTLERLDAQNLPRAAQLTQKTNQFNLTAQRRTEADMQAILTDGSRRVYIAGLTDKFGDYGRIALCVARLPGGTDGRAEMEIFLMSCRVMGRGVERAFLRAVEDDLARAGVTGLTSSYVPTPKNGVAADFWPRMGYTRVAGEEAPPLRYEAHLPFRGEDGGVIKVEKARGE